MPCGSIKARVVVPVEIVAADDGRVEGIGRIPLAGTSGLDLRYEEIADVLQISLGTVKSRILRGREALRKILAGRLEPGPALHWTPQPAD